MSEESTNIISKEQAIVKIATSLEDLKEQMALFQKLKVDLLTKDDTQKIGSNNYVKKSGWVKYALAFNLKTEIIKEEKETNTNDSWYAYHFTIRCTATNGRITEKVGSCDSREKPQAALHVIRAMAETRATSRAISAMIGAGEVSAEEMEHTGDITSHNTEPSPVSQQYLDTLKNLGYTGIAPKTSFDAAKIIEKLKSTETKNPDDYCPCNKFIPSSVNGIFCQTCGKKKPEDEPI